ncbi:MAG: exodeoxyribonuclease VII large subunit, partial [Erysipelotrichaceae bacterium]
MSERAVVSVSILTEHIKKILEKQDLFKGLRISGEISNLTKHSSGHWYFSLKDETSQIKCVMWKGNNAKIPFLVKDGMAVVVEADLAMYAQRSELQLVVKNMTNKEEIGSLHAQYLKRYETLEKQGYFAQSHKKALPAFPMDIAVLS